MKKIAVVGCNGKMGKLVCERLKKNFAIAKIDKGESLANCENLDLVVDFSTHENSVLSAKYCLKKHIPIIIGATGHTAEEIALLNEISKHILVLRKANFSAGIDYLKMAISSLGVLPQKIEIIEKHHKNKKDSPSGTALELKTVIEKNFSISPNIISVREGEEMGEHEVKFYFQNEIVSLKHNVLSRDAFVDGVEYEIKRLNSFDK